MHSFVLETFHFSDDHTAANICQQLQSITEKWALPAVTCCVTDNAANMLAGIKEAEWKSLPCFVHTLNLIVQDSIKADSTITLLQTKCRAIVSYFHRSVKAAEKLKTVQEQLSITTTKLIQDVITRWNSTYNMFERIVSQHEAITTSLCLLGKNDLCLSNEEIDILKNTIVSLKPFLEATNNISGESYVSVSLIIPLCRLLQQHCRLQPHSLLSPHLISQLQRRFAGIEANYLTAVSTLLDPRFKKIPFADASCADQAIRRMTDQLKEHLIPIDDANSEVSLEETTQSTESLWNIFDERVAEATSH